MHFGACSIKDRRNVDCLRKTISPRTLAFLIVVAVAAILLAMVIVNIRRQFSLIRS